jgi:uncharacterized membrane protein YdjX (TVP38/TMEM64 family)
MNISLKQILAFIYILCLGILLFFVFSYLDFNDLSSYTYIREKGHELIKFKDNNFLIFVSFSFIFSILWILFLGFMSPIAIMSGFIFGPWIGTILTATSFTIGSSLLYLGAKLYFVDFIKRKFSLKINKYIDLFKKNEFFYFLMFRLSCGLGIPFFIQNTSPVIFNMKLKNYFYSTLIGIIPTLFIINSLGSGIEKLILDNENISYKKIILEPNIYWPIIGFILILIMSLLIRKKIFKSSKS